MSDFKTNFNSAHQQLTEAESNQQAAMARLFEAKKREYPRLCNELLAKTEALFAGVDGVEISKQLIEQDLEYFDGESVKSCGKATIPVWSVTFHGKSVVFKPSGVNWFGIAGKIEVATKGPNPFFKEAIFMQRSSDNPDVWFLAVTNAHHHISPLTDKVFEESLSTLLLGK